MLPCVPFVKSSVMIPTEMKSEGAARSFHIEYRVYAFIQQTRSKTECVVIMGAAGEAHVEQEDEGRSVLRDGIDANTYVKLAKVMGRPVNGIYSTSSNVARIQDKKTGKHNAMTHGESKHRKRISVQIGKDIRPCSASTVCRMATGRSTCAAKAPLLVY